VWSLFVPNMLAMLVSGFVFFGLVARVSGKSMDVD